MLEIAGEGNIDGKEINNDQSGGNLYGPSNMIYEQQNRPTKLQYEDPIFINPSPLFPIYDHPKSKFESDHYKHLIINELAKIPSHEINTIDDFIYSEDLFNDKFKDKKSN